MKMINPTEDQINAAVAEKVAGWTKVDLVHGCFGWKHPRPSDGELSIYPLESFTRSMDAVLPLLEKHHWNCRSHGMSGSTHGYPHCTVTVTEFPVSEHPERFGTQHEGHCFSGDSIATALPLAACIALLRAYGVEVEFTK